jgi:MFS transporter, ACS family, hexuronate transporter
VGALVSHRQTWAIALAKFLTDPVWWFYLFWLADFLKKEYGIGLSKLSLPLIVIYVVADVGSIRDGRPTCTRWPRICSPSRR